MASNPPITTFQSNGSLDLQSRINRFLSTLEPHARFFLAQGRTHLDSLVERDKTQNRILKPDKTGWAAASGNDGTVVEGGNDADGDARGSHVSITAMSSVSQRGGRVARMRDRNGNTATAVALQNYALGIMSRSKSTPRLKVSLPETSSSPPLQPWKDIRPAIPEEDPTKPESRMKPVVEIPDYRKLTDSEHAELYGPPSAPAQEVEKSKKRKLVVERTSERWDENEVKKSRKGENDTAKPKPQLVVCSKKPKFSMVVGAEASRRREKEAAESKENATAESSIPKKQEISENTWNLRPVVRSTRTKAQPLVDSSSKINSAAKPKEAKASKNVKETAKQSSKTIPAKSSKRQNATQSAEDKAREEILTARRNKRREKLALKTTSVSVPKKSGTKARPRDPSEEDSDEEVDGSARKTEQDAEKKGGRVARKSVKDHKEPSMALLKAYEVSGHLDRRRRITLPTPKLRSGLFGKGIVSVQTGKSLKEVQHPPDLQFQADAFLKKRKRKAIPSSSSTDDEEAQKSHANSQSSDVSRAKIRKSSRAPRKQRTKTADSQRPKPKSKRVQSEKSSSVDGETDAEERSRHLGPQESRQVSPDWPTVLPEGDEPEETAANEAATSEASREEVARTPTDNDMTNAGKPRVIIPALLSTPEIDLLRSDAKAAVILPEPDIQKEEPRDRAPQLNQRYQNDSCSPSLDADSYADMLEQALARSSAESSSLIMDLGAVVEGDQVLVREDASEQDEHFDDRQPGSQTFPCDVGEVIDQNPRHEYDMDEDSNPAYAVERISHVPCDADEAGYQEATFDTMLDSTNGMQPAADPVAQRFPDNTHVACKREVARLIVVPANDGSIYGSTSLDMEADTGDEIMGVATKNDTLDIFGTDAEQARKVIYGTRAHR